MLEWLIGIDNTIFIALNSIHSPLFDQIMELITKTKTWFPFYALVIFAIFKQKRWMGFVTLLFLILLIVIADQSSVHCFKNVFQRLRPCHQEHLQGIVHIVNDHCGGQYGFISSHATNTFAFAIFSLLFFTNRKYMVGILIWATVISYTRIYLGVHFPGDVIGGAIWGSLVGFFTFFAYKKAEIFITNRKKKSAPPQA